MTAKFHGKIFPQYVMALSRRQIRGWCGAGAAMDYFEQKVAKGTKSLVLFESSFQSAPFLPCHA
jgi:hypothetical protein